MFSFIPTNFKEAKLFIDEYLTTLTGINDDFWEEHIINCQLYYIKKNSLAVGVTGIYNNENLTLFYVAPKDIKLAQPAFESALLTLKPQYAFVPTNDELFLSLSLDKHISVDKQAYFFQYNGTGVRPAEFGSSLIRLATLSDIKNILDDNAEEYIRQNKYYVMYKNGIFLGQGVLYPNPLVSRAAAIGMHVHPDHRQKGVGRSIIMHLTKLCLDRGLIPVPGCWYYNHNSKLTLESAGYVTKTRLLKVWFTDKPKEVE